MRERLVKGRFVLVVYPVFATVAVMTLGDANVEPARKTFLFACLVYPLLYLLCLAAVAALRKRRKRIAAFVMSGVPLQYLGLIAIFAAISLLVEATIE
jgi:hypothetical protein